MYNRNMNQTLNHVLQPYRAHESHIGGFALSLGAVLYICIGALMGIIIYFAHIQPETDLYLYLNYIAAPIAMTITMAVTLKVKKFPVRRAYPVKCSPKYYLIALLLIYGLLFSVSWIDTGITELLKLMGYQAKDMDAYLPNLSGGYVALALLAIGVLPAVFEEGLFRGVILNSCTDGVGTIKTVLLVGFAFSLFHASAEQTVYQFLAGCVFAFLAIRAGSIIPTVIMHFLNNGLIVVFAACGLLNEAGDLVLTAGGQAALITTSALAFFGGMVWLILDKKPVIKGNTEAVKAFFIYGSIGIGLMGLMWILSFFNL